MTEKKPKGDAAQYFEAVELPPLPQSSMLLMKCGRLAGFDGRDGWPDAFTIRELAALQFPDDKALQGDLIALLWPRLCLEIECITVMRDNCSEGGIERYHTARALQELAQIEPSECVRAWLGPAWKDQGQGQAKARIGRPPDLPRKRRIVLAIIKAFEEVMGKFDGGKLPAPKEDFLAACHRIEKALTQKSTIFGIITDADTLASWLRPGYQFKSGNPKKSDPYMSQLVATMGRIPADLFKADS
jgi:hypothetical protein